MFSWDDLRVFLAVHRAWSHAAAARDVKLDSTTVSRRIAGLEVAVGARLFARNPAALVPTPAGDALFEHAQRIETEVMAVQRKLSGINDEVTGLVRLTASDGLTTYVLVPHLLTLRRTHPSLQIELLGDNDLLDLGRREADVAVRLTRPTERYYVTKRIGRLEVGVFGSRAYFAERRPPSCPEEIRDHDWVAHETRWDDTLEFQWFRTYVDDTKLSLRTRTTTALVSACASGYGLTILPVWYTRHDPRLVRVLPSAPIPVRDLWVVTHEDLKRSAPVSATIRWLAAALSPDVPGPTPDEQALEDG